MRVILITVFFLVCIFVMTTNGQDKRIGKTYWLKHNLIFLNMGYNPNVYPNDIFFADGCDQTYLDSSRILNKGDQVQLIELERAGKYAKVTLRTQTDTYNLVLHENWNGSIDPSFKLIFSQKEVDRGIPSNCHKDLKTKKECFDVWAFRSQPAKQVMKKSTFTQWNLQDVSLVRTILGQ